MPVVFVTLEALKDMTFSGNIDPVAGKIVTRLDAMCRARGIGPVREMQLDCDYTERTEKGYFALCQAMRKRLDEKGISLSSTLRLHQLRDNPPPVDAVILMLYNTDNFRRPDVGNSILNPETVKTYLKGSYRLPVSVALPVYAWGIWMRDAQFRSILHKSDYGDSLLYRPEEGNRFVVQKDHIVEGHELEAGDIIRLETSPYEVVSDVRAYALEHLDTRSIVLYHLDSLNLSAYSSEQIESLYGKD